MNAFFEAIKNGYIGFNNYLMTATWYQVIISVLDIIVVTLTVFFIIRLVRDSRAEQFLRGIVFLLLMYGASILFHMVTVEYLLKALFDNALLVLIVVFQPEVRRALEQAGKSRNGISRILMGFGAEDNATYIDRWNKAIKRTSSAIEILQKQKMGALIVFERGTRLGEIVRSGTIMEAEPSAALISNVFFNKAPLHDGAMILRDGSVYAASCILPLSDNLQISRELGTRHRAGVGMSENSDAIVVILSEETGMISVAEGGELQRNFTPETLAKTLADRILWSDEQTPTKKIFRWRKEKKEETV